MAGFGYYVPPPGGGEEALVNILPIILPNEIFVAATPYTGQKATAVLLDGYDPARFDWVIRGSDFWSLHDPRTSCCHEIVDLGQVEAIDKEILALHEDVHELIHFAYLLRNKLKHQVSDQLTWRSQVFSETVGSGSVAASAISPQPFGRVSIVGSTDMPGRRRPHSGSCGSIAIFTGIR